MNTMNTPETLDCGHPPSAHEVCTTGYGTDADGRTACYVCCAQRERAGAFADAFNSEAN